MSVSRFVDEEGRGGREAKWGEGCGVVGVAQNYNFTGEGRGFPDDISSAWILTVLLGSIVFEVQDPPLCKIGPASTATRPLYTNCLQKPSSSPAHMSLPWDSLECMTPGGVQGVTSSFGLSSSWTTYRSAVRVRVILRMERMNVRMPAGP